MKADETKRVLEAIRDLDSRAAAISRAVREVAKESIALIDYYEARAHQAEQELKEYVEGGGK